MILNPREEMVLKLRDERKTLEEIGKELNITRERVRQIEAKARHKINREFITQHNQCDSYKLVLLPDGDIEILGYYDNMKQAFSVITHKTYNPNETIKDNLIFMYELWEALTEKAYRNKQIIK